MKTFSELKKTIRFDWYKKNRDNDELELVASAGSDLSVVLLGFNNELNTRERIEEIASIHLYSLYLSLMGFDVEIKF